MSLFRRFGRRRQTSEVSRDEMTSDPYRGDIKEAVIAFIDAQSWEESKRIVEERQDWLLRDPTDKFLDYLLTRYKDNEHAAAVLEERQALLRRCRREGIDAAFVRHLQPSAATPANELEALMQELSSFTEPDEMPRRVAVCREALPLVDRGEQPELWAWLHLQLGNSLRKNPQGDKAHNIEEAISHYEQALAVYTKEDFPLEWGTTQNNLSLAYLGRIRGDKDENQKEWISRRRQALEKVYTPRIGPVE